ncbi:MAG: FadR family transcriptional regulator [Rhodothermaceae bacterium]|nr:FadR family transcriptional regulator [Rhodothermaceae bacterium]MXX96503.1 FadR family transcriptional regulator [Rhodothermaceae bacterium]MXZ59175.1 FadR family transcriptional regulator [Rhodothermaceae bacterium]MYB90247.1 FadR family transcriptional regulator [Rhodothermaceae bacterium]MYD68577.1 FadR family transcriptional regulator [Rhodothermaceae bacterium]
MTQKFTPVGKPQLLSHSVVEAIENSIRKNDLRPGMRLASELDLCSQFGVSRTVLREALRMLSGRGLIRIEKGRGIFVSELSAETVSTPLQMYLQQHSGDLKYIDLIKARQLIEPPIAAEAALYHTPDDARQLKEDFDAMSSWTGGNEELANLDLAFHQHIAIASGNSVVPLLIAPIHALMPQVKSSVHKAVEDAKYSAIEWHRRILDAILERDPEAARVNMEYHLVESGKHISRMLAAQTSSEILENAA